MTYFADGVHPNATGHAIMAGIYEAALTPLLSAVSAPGSLTCTTLTCTTLALG